MCKIWGFHGTDYKGSLQDVTPCIVVASYCKWKLSESKGISLYWKCTLFCHPMVGKCTIVNFTWLCSVHENYSIENIILILIEYETFRKSVYEQTAENSLYQSVWTQQTKLLYVLYRAWQGNTFINTYFVDSILIWSIFMCAG